MKNWIRYAESKTIKRLRIKAWFKAVSHASGLSASQLEYQFSLKKESPSRSCIWDKYRRGEVAPREGLVTIVEDCYPNTRHWLHSEFWRMIDHSEVSMAEVRDAYERLPKLLRSIFISPQATKQTVFWRRPVADEEVFEDLRRFGSIDAFLATLIAVKESEVTQNQYQHRCGVQLARQYFERFSQHSVLGHDLNQELRHHAESRWENSGYTEVDEDEIVNLDEGPSFRTAS